MRLTLRLFTLLAVILLPWSLASQTTPPEPAYYTTIQKDGTWWFQGPDGTRFFSTGVNVVSGGATKGNYRAAKPEYASFLYYPTTDAWAKATLKRLADWNFNTIGGWSHPIFQHGPLPFTVALNLGGAAGVPWSDLFSPQIAQKFDESAKREILPLRDNPHLLGYFSDNELGWWSGALFLHFISQPKENVTRQQMIRLLQRRYKDQLAAMQLDFNIGSAKTFDQVGHGGRVTLRPGKEGYAAIDEFVHLLAQRYYQLAQDSIRRYDQHHLILGDRFAAWYPQSVARAAGPYVDVISINTGADWRDGQISPFLLETLHSITGKPILVSEFYMCAQENRSGNKNPGAIFPTVRTQRERAAAFRVNLKSLAELPYVIGAHWFQYSDEPTYGRSDGENYNMGLVDIQDRPYEKLTAVAASLDTDAIHREAGEASTVAEPTLVSPLAATSHPWNERWTPTDAPLPSGAGYPFADLYAAWDRDSLFLVLYAADYSDRHLYVGDRIPLADAFQWTINTGSSGKTIQVRFGAGRRPTVDGKAAVAQVRQNSTRFMITIKIPSSSLEKRVLANGDSLWLKSSLTGFGGANRMQWDQPLQLQSSRQRAACRLQASISKGCSQLSEPSPGRAN